MKLKELNQNNFKMKIIKDLGMKKSRGSSNRNTRFAIFECNQCHKHFETIIARAKIKNQEKCKSCSQTKHGLSKDSLYNRYYSMIKRCYNEKSDHYASYGAIGVRVCKEWLDSFDNFKNWAINNGYKKHLELDKDIMSKKLGLTTAVYSPETCMFVTSEENNKHRKTITRSNTSGYKGVTIYANKFKTTINVDGKFIHLGLWDTDIEAAKAYDSFVISNNLERIHNNTIINKELVIYDNNKLRSDNKSGYRYVYKKNEKFCTYCFVEKDKEKHLGTFINAKDAYDYRCRYIKENNIENINKI